MISAQHAKLKTVEEILNACFDGKVRADSLISGCMRELRQSGIREYPPEFRALTSAIINDYNVDYQLCLKTLPEAQYGPIFCYNVARTKKEDLVLEALVRSLLKSNPGAKIDAEQMVSLLRDLDMYIFQEQKGAILTVSRPSLQIRGGFKKIHNLTNEEDLEIDRPQDLCQLERAEVEILIYEIRKQSLEIGDLEMTKLLDSPDTFSIKRAALRNSQGLAIGGDEVIVSDYLLAASLMGLGDARWMLKQTLIHEFNHLLDVRDRRLGQNPSADQKERSAMIRTSAYFDGQIYTDNSKFLVISYLPDGRSLMETTVESDMRVPGELGAKRNEKLPLSYYFMRVHTSPLNCDLCKFRLSPLSNT